MRTTLNLAEELAGRHDVEIVSVFRHRDEPLFAIDPRISVVPLIDTRPSS
ncbi:glycosyltransferase family 4 protein, partial [Streptomyces sp. NPDC005180]